MKLVHSQDLPPRPGPQLPIIRIRNSQIQSFTVLGAGLKGFWTHWNGKASEPCYEPVEECDACKKGLPRRWKGYLHCYHQDARQEGFLELTPTAAETLLGYLPKGDSLRCIRISLCRSSNSDKGRLRITVNPSMQTSEQLPPEKDPLETLSKLWKIPPEDGQHGLKVVS